jgi:hypothetical protein
VLFLKILIQVILTLIFIQDLRARSVYWMMFPFLIFGLVALRYFQNPIIYAACQPILLNIGFIITQLILVSAYFSVKNKKLTNITIKYLGLGDILFLISISFYLSVLNFLLFYMVSLITILIGWLTWQAASSKKDIEIPLAGLQAIIFMLFLAGDWWVKLFDLTDDTWLLNLISK